MNRSIELKIQEGNMIALPVFVMKQLLLRDGDTIRLSFDNEMKQHCFHINQKTKKNYLTKISTVFLNAFLKNVVLHMMIFS